MDGTFYSSPRPFHQLFVIQVIKRTNLILLVAILFVVNLLVMVLFSHAHNNNDPDECYIEINTIIMYRVSWRREPWFLSPTACCLTRGARRTRRLCPR